MSSSPELNRHRESKTGLLKPERQIHDTSQVVYTNLDHHENRPKVGFSSTSFILRHVIIVALWLGAAGVAVGQHFFYNYLNDSAVQLVPVPQTWVVRLGTAFAFAFKTLLVGAVGIIYAQVLYFIVQRTAVRLDSLEALFGVLNNPLLFLNRDLIQRTTLLFGIAVVSWLVPLSAVVAPGALTGSPQCGASNHVSNQQGDPGAKQLQHPDPRPSGQPRRPVCMVLGYRRPAVRYSGGTSGSDGVSSCHKRTTRLLAVTLRTQLYLHDILPRSDVRM
jgi:hypothetical protein